MDLSPQPSVDRARHPPVLQWPALAPTSICSNRILAVITCDLVLAFWIWNYNRNYRALGSPASCYRLILASILCCLIQICALIVYLIDLATAQCSLVLHTCPWLHVHNYRAFPINNLTGHSPAQPSTSCMSMIT